ncbi:MAG: DUF1294 domain-containing protein [Anaerolineae bacterium]|nr:DUF1294 domain-containing protein [Anaerolineae bacterium]
MSDQRIECSVCGRVFTWSYGEQRYYAERNLQRPKRCPDCRTRQRAARSEGVHSTPLVVEPVPIPEELLATADRLSGRDRRTPSPAKASAKTSNPVYRRAGLITLGGALVVALILWARGLDVVTAWLIAITGVTFLTYGYDKAIAGSPATRVPEKVLLALAWCGGTLGAGLGMWIFHHKTAKESFQFKFTLLLLVQSALVVTYFYLTGS